MKSYLPGKELFNKRNSKGFTLIELLIVIAIIAALAIVVFVALNPAKRLLDSRDARRTADVDSILTAIHQSIVDNKGSLPTNMPAAGVEAQLGTGAAAVCAPLTNAVSGCAVIAGQACVDLITGANNVSKYLKTMPVDPLNGAAANTKYSVVVDTNGIVTVKACSTEGTTSISSSR